MIEAVLLVSVIHRQQKQHCLLTLAKFNIKNNYIPIINGPGLANLQQAFLGRPSRRLAQSSMPASRPAGDCFVGLFRFYPGDHWHLCSAEPTTVCKYADIVNLGSNARIKADGQEHVFV